MKILTKSSLKIHFSSALYFSFFIISVTLIFHTVAGFFCLSEGGIRQPLTNKAIIIEPRKPDTRPACQEWYTIHLDETQWAVSEKFAPKGRNRQEWIASMRYMSHKSEQDQHLRPGETVCIKW